MRGFVVFLLSTACTSESTTTDPTDTTDPTQPTGSDTSPDDTGATPTDTGTPTETGTPTTETGTPLPTDEVVVRVDGDATGLTLGVFWLNDYAYLGDDDYGLLQSQVMDSSDRIVLDLPEPGSAEAKAKGWDGAGTLFVTAFEDTDGDGVQEPGELFVSAVPLSLSWSDDKKYGRVDNTPGWVVIDWQTRRFAPLRELPLTIKAPNAPLTLSGTWTGPKDYGLLAAPNYGKSLLFDEPLPAGAFSVTIDQPGPGPTPTGYEKRYPGLTLYFVYAYQDLDTSGDFNPGESIFGVCGVDPKVDDYYSDTLVVYWLDRSDDLPTTWTFQGQFGWGAIGRELTPGVLLDTTNVLPGCGYL